MSTAEKEKVIGKKSSAKSVPVPPETTAGEVTKEAPAPLKSEAAASPLKDAKAKEKPAKEKIKKPKLIRDSFTMPEAEYEALREVKKACMKAGFDVKKSELLRVGVALLKKKSPEEIQAELSGLIPLKAGRPKKTA